MDSHSTFRLTLLAAIVALGLCAPSAVAGTAALGGGVFTYTAAPGEDNNVKVFHPISAGAPDTSQVVIDEDGIGVTVGAEPAGCTKPSTTQVSCPAASVTSVTLNLGDLDDSARGGETDTGVNADFNKPVTFSGSSGADTLIGEDGADTFIGSSGNDILEGQAGADSYDCSTDFDTVSYDDDRGSGIFLDLDNDGYPDNDTFVSESACEKWAGTAFNDTFLGNTGANTFDGFDGTDMVRYDDGRTSPVVANLTTGLGADGDTLTNVENLRGSVDNDTLTGSTGPNQLDGLEGNDVLIGAAGTDALNGGDGTNTASYEERATPVTADLEGAKPDSDTYSLITSLRGGSGNDTLFGSAAQNTLDGGPGNDALVGRGANDALIGGTGVTDLASYEDRGTAVVASLFTSQNPDNDIFSGIEGLRGGTGVDTLTGGNAGDILQGGGNDDTLIGGLGADVLDGGAGTNTASYQDSVASGAGGRANGVGIQLDLALGTNSDGDTVALIQRFAGTDFVDTMQGSAGADDMSGEDGNDTISGADGPDTLRGLVGADQISGGPGDDAGLDGGEGDDTVSGDAGADTLRGGASADILDGGTGADSLVGEDGNDDLRARDGEVDVVDCGLGAADKATVDAADTRTGCEEEVLDADGDGVPDSGDACPNEAGTLANGCNPPPDADSDGVPDSGDACPNEAGALANGCNPVPPPPDADSDGVPDAGDACPNQAGTLANGCNPVPPPPDADSDGVPDATDPAPNDPKIPAAFGATNGDDILNGTAAGDTICGLLGNDTVNGLAGNDSLFGDVCNTTAKLAQVTTDGNDRLNGGNGNDALHGAGGKDTLRGGKGKDKLFGGAGNDSLNGEGGSDSLDGGKGNDKLTGGKDVNKYKGGAGNDVMNAWNGKKETVDCGKGKKDTATVDRADTVKGCERVARPRR